MLLSLDPPGPLERGEQEGGRERGRREEMKAAGRERGRQGRVGGYRGSWGPGGSREGGVLGAGGGPRPREAGGLAAHLLSPSFPLLYHQSMTKVSE